MTACIKEKNYKIQEISLKLLVLIQGTENVVTFLSFFTTHAHYNSEPCHYLTIFTHLNANTCKKIIHARLILLFFKPTAKFMYFCIHLLQ